MSHKPTNALFLSGIWLHRLQACLDWPDDSSSVHHSSLLSPCWLPHVCPQVTKSKNGWIWPDKMQWYLVLDLFVCDPFQPALWVPGRCLCCWPWQSKMLEVSLIPIILYLLVHHVMRVRFGVWVVAFRITAVPAYEVTFMVNFRKKSMILISKLSTQIDNN